MNSIAMNYASHIVMLFALLVVNFNVFICPFNKVEESFNMQAMHDLLYHNMNISEYDHLKFPGVVPRTFLGPIIPALFLYVSSLLLQKPYMQLTVRIFLGLLFLHSLYAVSCSLNKKLNKSLGLRFVVITCSQFHLMFYASRSLPNTFALITVLHSLAALLQGNDHRFIIMSGIGILIFRSELMLFYGPILLFGIYFGLVKMRWKLISIGLITTFISIAATVLVDSYFWRRFVWPEGEVFYFNAILNKSNLWGTLPFYWYFAVGLPKALMTTLGLVICGNIVLLSNPRLYLHYQGRFNPSLFLGLEIAALVFVIFYSCLPHKELRFVIYALPIFNMVGAFFWDYTESNMSMCITHFDEVDHKNRSKGKRKKKPSTLIHWICRMAVLVCYASLIINFAVSGILLFCSSYNYPGGEAISKLHVYPSLANRTDVNVYIANLAAQTGVNRFQEANPHWRYNKTEGIEDSADFLINSQFTHLILECDKDPLKGKVTGFHQLFIVKAFSSIRWNFESWYSISDWLEFELKPALIVYQLNTFNH